MPDFNKVILMGRLTRDPETRYTASGMAVTKIGLAVGRRYFNKNSQQAVEETAFVDCEAWGKQAETLNQYMRKGRPLMIEGRLKYDTWETKEGQKRSKLVVVIENFQFVDSTAGGGGGDGHDGGGGGGDGERRSAGGYSRNAGGAGSGGGTGSGGGAGSGARGAPPQVQAGNVSDRGGGEDYDFEDIPF